MRFLKRIADFIAAFMCDVPDVCMASAKDLPKR
jgi:hypothetical protein